MGPEGLLDRSGPVRGGVPRVRRSSLAIEALRENHLVGIRFHPGGAYPFFRFAQAELTDRVIDIDLLDRRCVPRGRREPRVKIFQAGRHRRRAPIDAGYHVAAYTLMGLILGAWREARVRSWWRPAPSGGTMPSAWT